MGRPSEVFPEKNKELCSKIMKMTRFCVLLGIVLAGLGGPLSVWAQNNTPPTVTVVPTGNVGALNGVPQGIKTLVLDFAVSRDKYLSKQDLLLIKLSHATTDSEREKIRDALQANRDAFMGGLQEFRAALKDDLQALQGKITHAEFLRIVEAAHEAATEGGVGLGHHKGH